MRPISLRRRPPRDPRARLAGLMLLPRTIDKARAALPGGDPGDYVITPGLSAGLLNEIRLSQAEFVALVRRAADETAIAAAVAERIDPERRERWNAWLQQLHVCDLAPDARDRFIRLHDARPESLAINALIADDRSAFAAPDRGVRAANALSAHGRDDGAQPHGGLANLVDRDDQRRDEAQRVAPCGVEEDSVFEAARDEVRGGVSFAHRQSQHETDAARLVEEVRILSRYRS